MRGIYFSCRGPANLFINSIPLQHQPRPTGSTVFRNPRPLVALSLRSGCYSSGQGPWVSKYHRSLDSASNYYVVSLLGAIGEQWGSLCFHGSQHTTLVLGNDLIINSESNRNMISIHNILYFSIGVSSKHNACRGNSL